MAIALAAHEKKTVANVTYVLTNPNLVDLASKNRSVSSGGVNSRTTHTWEGSDKKAPRRRRQGCTAILNCIQQET